MTPEKNPLTNLIADLKQQHDELALQMHLAKAEAKEEFQEAKTKLDGLTEKYDPLLGAIEESAENVNSSLELVAEEVKSSFERVLKLL